MRRRRYAIVGVCPNGSMAHPDIGFIPSKIYKNNDHKAVTTPYCPFTVLSHKEQFLRCYNLQFCE